MKRYSFLYILLAYSALSNGMGLPPKRHTAAWEVMKTKPFEDRVENALRKAGLLDQCIHHREGAISMIKATLELCPEEEDAWLNAPERTQADKDWYYTAQETLKNAVAKYDTTPTVLEEGAQERRNLIEAIMATEAFRQGMAAEAHEETIPQSSTTQAMEAGYHISLEELLQAINHAQQEYTALEQEKSESEAAVKELQARIAALIEDQQQLSSVAPKSPQVAGMLAILIAGLASDAENAAHEAALCEAEWREAESRQQTFAAQWAGTVQAANQHYNETAAQRAETARRLQDLAFELEKARKEHAEATRRLEQLSAARDLAAQLGKEGRLSNISTCPTDE